MSYEGKNRPCVQYIFCCYFSPANKIIPFLLAIWISPPVIINFTTCFSCSTLVSMSCALTPCFCSFRNNNCFLSHKWTLALRPRKWCSLEQHLVWVALSKNPRHNYLSATEKVNYCKNSYYFKSCVRKLLTHCQ